ncbi:alpha/beta hydrolase [Jannaschia sp. R86511]|uniref:alpha/beta hydrolase n=1 Tax=Jannaschia sp. R86511 TaxID=3093853 RepID=UPI0036D2CD1D
MPATHNDVHVALLGGAGLPPWVWDGVRDHLAGVKCGVVVPLRRPDASAADVADDLVAQLPPARDVVLVAHSVGGVVAAQVLARHPGRVAAVLGVAAVVPRPGRSFVAAQPWPARAVLGPVLRRAGTLPPERARRAATRGVQVALADRLVADAQPEPVRLFLDPVPSYPAPAASAYLATGRDREVTARQQARSARAMAAAWVETLPTGHLPMLEDPVAVAGAVVRLVADVTGRRGRVDPTPPPSRPAARPARAR